MFSSNPTFVGSSEQPEYRPGSPFYEPASAGGKGGAGATVHKQTQAEVRAYCEFINLKVGSKIDPGSPTELFAAVSGGVLLVDLLRALSEEAKKLVCGTSTAAAPKNKFEALCNHKAVLDVAVLLRCSITNIGPEDLLAGTPYLVAGLVWQLLRYSLLAGVTLEAHPELAALRQEGENAEAFVQLGAEQRLLRWVNHHMEESQSAKRVANFGRDFADSEAYLLLLHRLEPSRCSLEGLALADPLARAEAAVDSAKKCLGEGVAVFVEAADVVAGNDKLNLALVATLFSHGPALKAAVPSEELEKAMEARSHEREQERARVAAELEAKRREWEEEERQKRDFLDGEALRLHRERQEFESQKRAWGLQQQQQQDQYQQQMESQKRAMEAYQWQQYEQQRAMEEQRRQWEEWQRRQQQEDEWRRRKEAEEAELRKAQADMQLLRVYENMQQWVVTEYGRADESQRFVLREWFTSVDQDSSSLIDPTELQLALSAAGEKFEPSMVGRLFSIFDESGAKKMSFEAFCNLFQFIQAMRTAFNGADVYSAGFLDLPSLELALANARYHFQEPATPSLLFRTFDRSRRSRLSFENFLETVVTLAICRKEFQHRFSSASGSSGSSLRMNLSQVTDVVTSIVASADDLPQPSPPPSSAGASRHHRPSSAGRFF